MSEFRNTQIKSRVKEIVSKYISRESNGKSIITVTTVDTNERGDKATIFFTVIPEKEEEVALDFLKRKRNEIRKEIMKNLPIARIPFVDVAIDKGEKLARRITEIEMQEKNQE